MMISIQLHVSNSKSSNSAKRELVVMRVSESFRQQDRVSEPAGGDNEDDWDGGDDDYGDVHDEVSCSDTVRGCILTAFGRFQCLRLTFLHISFQSELLSTCRSVSCFRFLVPVLFFQV